MGEGRRMGATNEQEELPLSQKKRSRLKVRHEAEKGYFPRRKAAEQPGISERRVRTRVRRLRVDGDATLVHGLKAKRSNQWENE